MEFQGLLMTGGQVLGVAGAAAGVEVVAVFSVVGIASHDRLSDDKAGWEQGVGDGALLSVLFAEAAAQAAQSGADAGPGAGGDPGCLDHRGPEAASAAMARLWDTHGIIKRGRHWYRLFAQVRSAGGTVPAALS
ncbi:hypothetical protein ACFQX6_26080 [Streptosporangium lutulentum]